jgi:phage terminase large subunit
MLGCFSGMPGYSSAYYNMTEAFFNFPSGSRIEIRGADNDEEVMGYNGHVAWLNEPYSITKDTFDQIDQRTEDFILIDYNPKQGHWTDQLEKDPRTIIIHSTFRDNPFCPPEQRKKILSYQPVSFCEIAKLMGEAEAKAYDIVKNQLNYTEKQLKELVRCKENERKGSSSGFNWSVYGLGEKAEKPNRIFNWKEISLDDYHKINTTRYYGSDWGVVDPWGVVEAKYYDGALYLNEKNYASENEIMASLTMHEIAQVQGKEEGLIGWQFDRMGIPKNAVIVCDDNRPGKVLALRRAGYDYAITASKGSGSIMDGINSLEKLKVYFTETSKNIKYEQENYSRKVDRYGVVLDEPEDSQNHTIDPTRYILSFLKMQGIVKII